MDGENSKMSFWTIFLSRSFDIMFDIYNLKQQNCDLRRWGIYLAKIGSIYMKFLKSQYLISVDGILIDFISKAIDFQISRNLQMRDIEYGFRFDFYESHMLRKENETLSIIMNTCRIPNITCTKIGQSKCIVRDILSNHIIISSLHGRCRRLIEVIDGFSSQLYTSNVSFNNMDSLNIHECWEFINSTITEASGLLELNERREAMLRGTRQQLENEYYRFMKSVVLNKRQELQIETIEKHDMIKAFLRLLFVEQDKLDFDCGLVSTTWFRIFYSLRSGLLDRPPFLEHRGETVVSDLIWLLVEDWNQNGGQLSPSLVIEVSLQAETAFEELTYKTQSISLQFKLVVLLALLADKSANEKFLGDFPYFFSTMEDFIWFKITCTHEKSLLSSHSMSYSMHEFQKYSNNFGRKHYNQDKSNHLAFIKIFFLCLKMQTALSLMYIIREQNFIIIGIYMALYLYITGILDLDKELDELPQEKFFDDLSLHVLNYSESIKENRNCMSDHVSCYTIAYLIENSRKARKILAKEMMRILVCHSENLKTLSYSEIKNGIPILPIESMSTIFNDQMDIFSIVKGIAENLEIKGDCLRSAKIYACSGLLPKAMEIVNKTLTTMVKNPAQYHVSSKFFELLELGESINSCLKNSNSESLLTTHPEFSSFLTNENISNNESFFFDFLVCYITALTKYMKRNFKQVIQLFENIGLIRERKLLSSTPEYNFITRRIPEAIIFMKKCSFESYT
jgi:hypothetical protein